MNKMIDAIETANASTDPQRKASAFELAAEATKQLLTLTTAVLTGSVIFTREIVTGSGTWTKVLLGLDWAACLTSVWLGTRVLMELTTELWARDIPNLQTEEIKSITSMHQRSFLVVLALTGLCGLSLLMRV